MLSQDSYFQDHLRVIAQFASCTTIDPAAQAIIASIAAGGTLFICGNGGSAADAQHIAAEFTGRYLRKRRSLSAVALTTDTSAITAIGNDYSFEEIFSRQLEGLGKSEDILLAISTSGNSKNVIKAVEVAAEKGMKTIGLLGRDGGALSKMVDIAIVVPSDITARVQEGHILVYHILCEEVDAYFSAQEHA